MLACTRVRESLAHKTQTTMCELPRMSVNSPVWVWTHYGDCNYGMCEFTTVSCTACGECERPMASMIWLRWVWAPSDEYESLFGDWNRPWWGPRGRERQAASGMPGRPPAHRPSGAGFSVTGPRETNTPTARRRLGAGPPGGSASRRKRGLAVRAGGPGRRCAEAPARPSLDSWPTEAVS